MASSWCGLLHAQEPPANVPPPALSPIASVPRVHFRSAPGCPSEAYLFDAIERLLRQPIDTPRREVIGVEAELLQGSDGAYEVHVRAVVDGHASERRLSHRSCTQLTDAAALMMAMAIDADAVGAAGLTPAPKMPPAASPSPEMPVSRPSLWSFPLPSPEPLPRRVRLARGEVVVQGAKGWSLSVSALGGAIAGPLPHVAGSVGLLVSGLEGHGWGVGLSGRTLFAQSVSVPGYDARIRLSPLGVGARGCWYPRRDELRLGFCLGPELVSVGSEPSGTSFASSKNERTSYWQAVAQAVADYAIVSSVRGGVELEFGAAPRSPQIGLEEDGAWREVARPKSWSAGAGLRLGIELY
jgi:hypothetical protein